MRCSSLPHADFERVVSSYTIRLEKNAENLCKPVKAFSKQLQMLVKSDISLWMHIIIIYSGEGYSKCQSISVLPYINYGTT